MAPRCTERTAGHRHPTTCPSPIRAPSARLRSGGRCRGGVDEVGCAFCGVLRDPAQLVLDEGEVAAFLDHRPLFHGHTLVVPRAHVGTLDELDPPRLLAVFGAVQRVMRALETALGAEGTFVAANNRVSQSVPHLHVHVVPRRRGDGLRGFFWPRTRYDDAAELDAWRTRVRDAIAAQRLA